MSGHDEPRLGRLSKEVLIPVKGGDTSDIMVVRHGDPGEYASACAMRRVCGKLVVE